jgi:hypothetical protein
MCSVDPTRDSQFKRTVLLLRALPSSVDQCKKKPGYRSEILVVVELVVADLTLSKELVVLQAVRKDADFQQMVFQLALSCWHFQLIARANAGPFTNSTVSTSRVQQLRPEVVSIDSD